MIIEIKIPSPGESITEVELASWFVENGSNVSKDQEIGEIESEKATLPLIAEKAGKVELLAEVGDTLAVGTVACKIDTSVQPEEKESSAESNGEEDGGSKKDPVDEKEGTLEKKEDSMEKKEGEIDEKDKKEAGDTGKDSNKEENSDGKKANIEKENIKITPVARKMMLEEGFSVEDIISGLRKITSSDVQAVKEAGQITKDPGTSAGT
ncbi:MAG: hypothetical protein LC655_05855, partial [Bacteroidales bacterium]|nr:hypothetical protein [Bacteroidales bacterium]